MTIGERIKELRKKHDMTQEKLADYLCVSYQAVSKWECGLTSPDLSLIAPLTKLLHVSADELLGLNEVESDTRYDELTAAYERTFKTEDFAERQRICETAVNEYPGDMKFLCDLAWVVSNRSFEHEDNESYIAEQEKAIKLFGAVIKNCGDEKMHDSAIHGIVQLLGWRKRKDEAKKYAEMLPEKTGSDRASVWENCLDGEELIKFKQERVMSNFENMLWDIRLMPYGTFSETIEALIKIMMPDGNYLKFNHHLYYSKQGHINLEMTKGGNADFDLVMKLLTKMRIHAAEYDRILFANPGVYRYTSPLFDRIETYTREWSGSEGKPISDDFRDYLADKKFDVIREHDEFKACAVMQSK